MARRWRLPIVPDYCRLATPPLGSTNSPTPDRPGGQPPPRPAQDQWPGQGDSSSGPRIPRNAGRHCRGAPKFSFPTCRSFPPRAWGITIITDHRAFRVGGAVCSYPCAKEGTRDRRENGGAPTVPPPAASPDAPFPSPLACTPTRTTLYPTPLAPHGTWHHRFVHCAKKEAGHQKNGRAAPWTCKGAEI